MIVLSLLLGALGVLPSRPPTPEEKAAESAFRACPGGEMLAKTTVTSWQPITGAIVRHRAIRERQRLDYPRFGDRVLVHSLTLGPSSVERSVVATRSAEGLWHVDEAAEKTLSLAVESNSALPHKTYDLSVEESRRVDALLEDPCLYASPRFMMTHAAAGKIPAERLEIITSAHQAVLGWLGVRTPPEDALVKLIVRD